MGTFTAQISVGSQNEGGILPTHIAWLWEHSRPVWTLEPTRLRMTGDSTLDHRPGSQDLIRWFPERPRTILEDGLLLIAIHAIGEEPFLDLVNETAPRLMNLDAGSRADGVELLCQLDGVAAEHLGRLRRLNEKTMPEGAKLVLTVLEGSSIRRQLPSLERYPMEVEVCTATYSRQRKMSAWSEPTTPQTVQGSLEARPEAEEHSGERRRP